MNNKCNVETVFIHEFVTGGGLADEDLPASWVVEGAAMRRALVADFAEVPGVRVWSTRDARLPDEAEVGRVVRVGPGEERATFARLAAEADWTVLIAPEPDGRLADRAALLETVGGRSLGCTSGAIAQAGNKAELGAVWEGAGVPTPPSVRINGKEGQPVAFPYPVVIKPVCGAGAMETYVLNSADRAPLEVQDLGAVLLQPFESGTPMSASFLIEPGGRPHLVGVGRQRIAIQSGRLSYLGGRVPAGPLPCPAAVLQALGVVDGLRGWVGVDFLWDEPSARAVVLEINPRLTTSYVGLRALLPPGSLATAWLAAFEAGPEAEGLATLADRVHARPPLEFDADGTLRISSAEAD